MTTTTKWMLVMVAMLGAACGAGNELSPTLLVQLQVSPPTASVPAGVDQQLTAVAIFQNGRREDVSARATWSIVDESIARVDAKGLVTTALRGTTRVSASLDGLSGSAALMVSDAALASIELDASMLRIPLGATLTAAAWGHYTDGSVVDLTSQSAWSATTSALTLLTPGQSRAASKGPVRLCARFQAMQADVDLEVTDAALVGLQAGSVRSLAALPKGAISPLSVTADFTDGTELDVSADVTWQSDEPGIAEVVASRVRGVGHGRTRLVGSYQGQSVSVDVTVDLAEVVGLALYPPLATAPRGDFVALAAIATYSDGSMGDVSSQVTWSSLDPSAVQVTNQRDRSGRAYGLRRGSQTVVTAQFEGSSLSATTLVQVGAPTVKSIVIDQAPFPLRRMALAGSDLQLSATATFSDDGMDAGEAETQGSHDYTAQLHWESYSPGVAVADPAVPGLIHALSWGEATIVVTQPGNPLLYKTVTVFVR